MPIGFSFNQPPEDALKFFRAKGLKTSFAWQDMLHEAHDDAFTVAKMMDLDMLADVKAAVDEALATGKTKAWFRDQLEPMLKAKGWWGKGTMIDPATGEEREVQLGSPRRLKTIFQVNLRTSYMAGHWAHIQDTKGDFPYLLYDAIKDTRTRPLHRSWDGMVLSVDDPWWDTHTPQNGWNCRCSVIQVSDRQLKRLGKTGPDRAVDNGVRPWKNPRTGETSMVPNGIDPGWDYHPGKRKTENLRKNLVQKLEATDEKQSVAALRQLVRSESFTRFVEKPKGNFPVLRLPHLASQAIEATGHIAMLSDQSLTKNIAHHPDIRLEDYQKLPDIGDRPILIVQDAENKLVLVGEPDALYWCVVKVTENGQELYVTSFRRTERKDMDRLKRRGTLIYGEWPK